MAKRTTTKGETTGKSTSKSAVKPHKPHTEKRRREWGQSFLGELERCGNVSKSCQAASIGRRTAYDRYKADQKFAAAWDEAIEIACDSLEAEARRRAVDGVGKPVYYRGRRVGEIREYSDTLLIFLLKAHRPQRFRERFQVDAYRLTVEDAQLLSDDELRRISRDEMTQAELMAIVASRKQQAVVRMD